MFALKMVNVCIKNDRSCIEHDEFRKATSHRRSPIGFSRDGAGKMLVFSHPCEPLRIGTVEYTSTEKLIDLDRNRHDCALLDVWGSELGGGGAFEVNRPIFWPVLGLFLTE